MQSPEPMPPPAVLDAFGAAGAPMRLSGGFDGAWRCGDLVLKRSDAPAAALESEALVLGSVPDRGFRLQRLRRAGDGSLSVDGWIAREYLVGRHEAGRWSEILDVADALNAGLASVSRAQVAPMIDGRADPWAVADRIAWEERPSPNGAEWDAEPFPRLAAARRPVDAHPQLLHGDLTGNVLFADGLAPAVIDFSPYFRPPDYELGVVIADAVVWHGAGLNLLERVAGRPAMGQCLIRALLFRHATGVLLGRPLPHGEAATRYGALVDAALAL